MLNDFLKYKKPYSSILAQYSQMEKYADDINYFVKQANE